jgi:hypothetical protein
MRMHAFQTLLLLRVRRLLSSLAAWAPVRRTVLVALAARTNSLAAARARPARPPVDRALSASIRHRCLHQARRLAKNPREDVRPEPPHRPSRQLQHGPVPQNRLVLASLQDQPRPPDDRPRAASPHLPAAAHAEMAPQDEPALEREQQVLPDRLDGLEPPAVEALGYPLRRRSRMRRLDREPLPDEHLQPPSGAAKRVTFWHSGASVASSPLQFRPR